MAINDPFASDGAIKDPFAKATPPPPSEPPAPALNPWAFGGAYGSGLSASDAGETGKGMIEGVAGLPLQVGRSLFRFGAQKPEDFSTEIFAKPKDDTAAKERLAGEIAGGLVSPLPALKVAEKVPGAVGAAGRVLERVTPGATERATGAISKIAEPIGRFDPLGQDIIKDTVGSEYTRLYDTRAKLLGTAAHITDESERTKAFRKIYQADEFAPLREFEQTPLGKKLTQTTGKYSEVVKADPAKIPHDVFDTPQSVRDFRNLLGGDQAKVDQYARRYAVESLNKVMDAARRQRDLNPLRSRASIISDRVDAWLADKNQEWLNETPATKKAIEDFAAGLRDTAKAQDRFRKGVGALGVTGLFESGMHPWSWINRLIGNLGE